MYCSNEIISLTQDLRAFVVLGCFLSSTPNFLMFLLLNWVGFDTTYLVLGEVFDILKTLGEDSEIIRNLKGGF